MSCGACTLCCTLMGVDEILKPPCTKCVHEAGKCTIYQFRPSSCREFKCSWLELLGTEHELPKSMRPDRCGALFCVTNTGTDVLVVVDPSRPEAMNHPGVRKFVARLAELYTVECKVGTRVFKARLVTEPEKPLPTDNN